MVMSSLFERVDVGNELSSIKKMLWIFRLKNKAFKATSVIKVGW